jgi:Na+-translocating ferredoxin:NAD+ oxidoreductase RnfG subunit
VLAAMLATMALSAVASATVLITVEEAVRLAFPDADTKRETLFLTEDQMSQVEAMTGDQPISAMMTRFTAESSGGSVGYAYLDTHRVRTLPETLMVVLDTSGAVRRVEVVVFREPLEYIPRSGWYEQFTGQELSDDLALKRGIRPVTGATLTARATTEAVRRILSIHAVVSAGEDR